MKEFELKYGCNPNQKPSKIFMALQTSKTPFISSKAVKVAEIFAKKIQFTQINLSGKISIVTGGSRGIGAAIVRNFSELGAKVFFTYKNNSESAEKLAKECNATAYLCDQSDGDSIDKLVDKIFSENAKALFNNIAEV